MGGELYIYLAEQEAEPERLARLTGSLRRELLELDVEDVTPVRAGATPPGTRALDADMIGGLVVSLSQSAPALQAITFTVRNWLTRRDGTSRAVRMELDGDALELSDATEADQAILVDLFIARHTTTGDRP